MFKERKQNADRVCEGISKIGYSFVSAIEDIVDNSITAGSSRISIELFLRDGATKQEKSQVSLIRVVDNGHGMDEEAIEKALDLGSEVEYEKNSLSRYGFGLKSAGLSLGRKVSVYSKKNGFSTQKHTLDRDIIKARNAYGVEITKLDECDDVLNSVNHGTVVEISNINTPHDSASKTLRKLRERLGVLYYELLKDKDVVLTLSCNDKEEHIEKQDILSLDIGKKGFNPDNYDGITPYILLDREIEIPGTPNIELTVVAFPQASMKNYPGFSDEQKNQIKSYRITRENSGFFIYRNDRLIRWGDNLGISNRDDINFRASIKLKTEHDEVLHVDVSKQNYELSEQLLDAVGLACRIPLAQAKTISALCAEILKLDGGGEGQKANETLEIIPEEDPDLDFEGVDENEKKKRRKKNSEITDKSETDESKEETSDNKTSETESDADSRTSFEKVRYTDKIFKSVIFTSEFDDENGIFVRINKNHLFYQLILNSLPEADPTRVAIEGLFYALAVGEKKTEENLQHLSHDEIISVFEKYHRVASYNVENWASHNQDLFK